MDSNIQYNNNTTYAKKEKLKIWIKTNFTVDISNNLCYIISNSNNLLGICVHFWCKEWQKIRDFQLKIYPTLTRLLSSALPRHHLLLSEDREPVVTSIRPGKCSRHWQAQRINHNSSSCCCSSRWNISQERCYALRRSVHKNITKPDVHDSIYCRKTGVCHVMP